MTDHSSAIAGLRAYLEVVSDLEPEGEWQHNPLVQKYQRSHYSLTHGEVKDLQSFLLKELQRIHEETVARKYHQLDLLGGGNDAQS